jgi:hypothetical protein
MIYVDERPPPTPEFYPFILDLKSQKDYQAFIDRLNLKIGEITHQFWIDHIDDVRRMFDNNPGDRYSIRKRVLDQELEMLVGPYKKILTEIYTNWRTPAMRVFLTDRTPLLTENEKVKWTDLFATKFVSASFSGAEFIKLGSITDVFS